MDLVNYNQPLKTEIHKVENAYMFIVKLSIGLRSPLVHVCILRDSVCLYFFFAVFFFKSGSHTLPQAGLELASIPDSSENSVILLL